MQNLKNDLKLITNANAKQAIESIEEQIRLAATQAIQENAESLRKAGLYEELEVLKEYFWYQKFMPIEYIKTKVEGPRLKVKKKRTNLWTGKLGWSK